MIIPAATDFSFLNSNMCLAIVNNLTYKENVLLDAGVSSSFRGIALREELGLQSDPDRSKFLCEN